MNRSGPGRAGRLVNRRSFLQMSASAAVLGLGAVGCGDATALVESERRVRQWNLFGGGDGARLIQMHDQFRAGHRPIDFEATTLEWGAPFYTKVAMAAAGGRSPDVATFHLSRLVGFSPGNLLDPFPAELLDEFGITKDKFLPQAWDKAVFDGQLYAIPLDTHPFVMYYNTDICKKAGVLEADGRLRETHGEDELIDLLTAVKDATGKWAVSIDTENPWRLWWTLYRQLDGEVLSEDGTELAVDDEKGVRALELMQRMAKEGLTPSSADEVAVVANFSNGATGLAWNGEWEVTTYETSKMPFSMTPFPDVFGSIRTYGDAHSFVLPHQRDRDEGTLRDTLTYVAWMLEHSVDWAAGGHIPAYQPVAQSQQYLDMEPQSEYRRVAEFVQFHPEAWFSGSGAEIEIQAAAAFTGVYSGRTPQQCLDQFKAAVQKLLDTPAPV